MTVGASGISDLSSVRLVGRLPGGMFGDDNQMGIFNTNNFMMLPEGEANQTTFIEPNSYIINFLKRCEFVRFLDIELQKQQVMDNLVRALAKFLDEKRTRRREKALEPNEHDKLVITLA